MTLLLGALTIGLILSLLALGVFISFRIFNFADITADGSVTLGASVAAVLLVGGVSPVVATLAAFAAGMAAGATTGILHTRFGINGLLSGILVMTALYSVNLHVMGKSNLPLLSTTTLATEAESIAGAVLGNVEDIPVFGWEIAPRDAAVLFGALVVIAAAASALYSFLRTDLGTAIRATGNNPQMIRALGVDVGNMIVLGLALSNGLIALAGALLAQYQGFADVQMGIGMVVWGLASVIIGEALVGTTQLGLVIVGTVMGSVLFRLLIAIALRAGLNPNDLKLVTALFVFAALILPGMLERLRRGRHGASHA
ncbi:MAG TPA: ABC transporter permease [Candidatus Binatia bacterium]|jgi:putative ABC transport system permease protein